MKLSFSDSDPLCVYVMFVPLLVAVPGPSPLFTDIMVSEPRSGSLSLASTSAIEVPPSASVMLSLTATGGAFRVVAKAVTLLAPSRSTPLTPETW